MSGSRTARDQRRRLATAMVAMFVPLLLLAAPAAAQDEDFPPEITNGIVSPISLPSNGGTVTVTASVHDDISVFSVGANAYGPGSFLTIPMLPTDDAGTYSGTFDIPANFAEEAVSHSIEVMAIDGTSGSSSAFVGDVEVAGNPPFDEKPIVWDQSVSPTSLPTSGGPVQLGVSAWDLRGVNDVYASITGHATGLPVTSYTVPLDAISADRFTGVFDAPANTSIFPAYYEIEFSASDDIGQQTIVSGERVTVAPRPTGQLQIKPGDRDFGKVKRGRTAQRTIVLKNVGAKGTLPIEGIVQASGAPFFLGGTSAPLLVFRLKPGESRTYHVEFRPTAIGPAAGRINVVRSDSGQPGLHALLTGRGT